MEDDFFRGIEPKEVPTRSGTVELPIRCAAATCAAGFFSAPAAGIKALLPSPDLVPVEMRPGRAVVAFAAFACHDTSIGPCRKFGIAVPVSHRPKRRPGPVAALRMLSTLSFEAWVWKLPVTSEAALEAGIDVWGWPGFSADIDFRDGPDSASCRLAAEGRHVLTLTVRKKKPAIRTYLDFNAYTVKDGNLLYTPVRGVSAGMARSVLPRSAALELGDHPLADEIGRLGLSSRAAASLYVPDLRAVLPQAERSFPL